VYALLGWVSVATVARTALDDRGIAHRRHPRIRILAGGIVHPCINPKTPTRLACAGEEARLPFDRGSLWVTDAVTGRDIGEELPRTEVMRNPGTDGCRCGTDRSLWLETRKPVHPYLTGLRRPIHHCDHGRRQWGVGPNFTYVTR
jgi:hypothetical protein